MKTTKSGERAAEPQLTKNKHNGGEKKQAPAEGEGGVVVTLPGRARKSHF